jgi:hypothetical protein
VSTLVFVPVLLSFGLGVGGPFAFVLLGILVVAFIGPNVLMVVRLIRRARQRRSATTRLRVGPDGIWTDGSGLLPWDRVSEIRTERAGWLSRIGEGPIERWRLAIVDIGGQRFGVNTDELDADFDGVIDLVRFYHPVAETS